MLNLTDTVMIPGHISYAALEDAAVLLNIKTNRYFELNEIGKRIWELLGEQNSLLEVCRTLENEYEVEAAQLERDALELLNQLVENGLVEIVPG